MPFHCPRCEAKARVIEVTRLVSGGKRRRVCCQNDLCGHRWSVWEEPLEPVPAISKPSRKRNLRRPLKPLTDEELTLILERKDLSNVQLGKILGRSGETIRQVRSGLAYGDRLPDLPRWSRASLASGPNCAHCAQWLGYCTLGFPEPDSEGLHFALECSAFLMREQAS